MRVPLLGSRSPNSKIQYSNRVRYSNRLQYNITVLKNHTSCCIHYIPTVEERVIIIILISRQFASSLHPTFMLAARAASIPAEESSTTMHRLAGTPIFSAVYRNRSGAGLPLLTSSLVYTELPKHLSIFASSRHSCTRGRGDPEATHCRYPSC